MSIGKHKSFSDLAQRRMTALLDKLPPRLEQRTRSWRRGLVRFFEDWGLGQGRSADTLYAFYDLAISPATFDIVVFLIAAETVRQHRGLRYLHVVFVPGPNQGFRHDAARNSHFSLSNKQWRLHNILIPSCWLIPGCHYVTVCTSRQEAQRFKAKARYVYPADYTVQYPNKGYELNHINALARQGLPPASLAASTQAKEYARQWLDRFVGKRRSIVITLRECSYQSERNSNVTAWAAFARSLDPTMYCPIIVRDIEQAFTPLPPELAGLLIFPEVVWNLELRLALYELSYATLSVSAGTAILSMLDRNVRYLLFKMITPSSLVATAEHVQDMGFEAGKGTLFATPHQRLVWQDDTVDIIQREFAHLVADIEKTV